MNQQRLTDLIEQWFDNLISDNDLAQLKAELLANKDSLKHYVSLAEMHSLLGQAVTTKLPQSNVVPIELIVRRQRRKTVRIASFAAAALIIIGVIVMSLLIVPEKQQGLAFETSPGSLFEITHTQSDLDASDGFTMENGSRLQLSQGTVKLIFNSGVKSIIIAPADITLSGYNQLQLDQGTAWFQVPKGAEGFEVTTNDLKIVDLGTEFGVISDPDGHGEVHVFKGEVELTSLRQEDEVANLTKNQARKLNTTGPLEEIDANPNAFFVSLPDSLPYIHWSFDGQDQLKVTGNHPAVENLHIEAEQGGEANFYPDEGRFGKALALNGNEIIQTDWHGIDRDNPRTVTFWIKLSIEDIKTSSILGWGKTIAGQGGTQDFYIYAYQSPDGASIGLSLGSFWLGSKTNIADGKWHHIAYSLTGKDNASGEPETHCYIDGKSEILTTHHGGRLLADTGMLDTADKESGSDPLWMFGHKWSWKPEPSISRAIDEVFIFQGALGHADILKLYKYNTLTPPSSLSGDLTNKIPNQPTH